MQWKHSSLWKLVWKGVLDRMILFKDLKVKIDDKMIINNFNLEVSPGELHVIMGPNGSGKSTLAYTIAGHPKYSIESGEIIYKKELINDMSPEERSGNGTNRSSSRRASWISRSRYVGLGSVPSS